MFKMKMQKKYILLSILVVLVGGIVYCELDHGLFPVNYLIRGKITFFKGSPPENTDRVEVFALKEFPPQNPENFLFLGRSGPLDYQGKNVLEYEIPVSPTSYEFVGVLWKEKGQDWNLTGLMGFYTGATGSFFPDTVFLSPDQPIVEDVDFTANWELVAKDARISGNIYYHRDWPQETVMLILAVFPNKPKTMFEFFTASNFDYTQPIFVDSSTYRLGVNSGVYNYIVLY
ncbi:MAG TPA: hypothetical protein ENN22_08570, partial [bacterium]|nr:hypothetical protein [bacterium]